MITRVTQASTSDFLAACSIERVFGSKNRTALALYGADHDQASFWIGYAADQTPCAAFYLMNGVLVAASDNRLPLRELADFVKEQRICEVDTNFTEAKALAQIVGGQTESSYYMEYHGTQISADFPEISSATELKKVFSVLQQSHEYYRTHLRYEQWSAELSAKLSRGLMELVQLEIDGVLVGTGSIVSEDDMVGVIAAVAVIPAYRGKGLGTKISQYLVNRILEKGKTPMLISGYDAVATLYRRVGFVETGRWGELYIQQA